MIYTASIKATPVQNAKYLKAIKASIRPCRIVVALTHFDSADIFQRDEDEEASHQEIFSEIKAYKSERLAQIQAVIDSDCRAQIPVSHDDIICLINKGLTKLPKEAQPYFSRDEAYGKMGNAVSRAYKAIRYKIKAHNVDNYASRSFITARVVVAQQIQQIQRKLEARVMDEFSKIRDRVNKNKIHHWTIEALLWHLYNGNEHISNAIIWDNVQIKTYKNFAEACLAQLIPPKFAANTNVRHADDRKRITDEFESNLQMELRRAAVSFFLYDRTENGTEEDSKCREHIRELALMPKYDKWAIMHDLLNCLYKRFEEEQGLLQKCLDEAIANAAELTYKRLMI